MEMAAHNNKWTMRCRGSQYPLPLVSISSVRAEEMERGTLEGGGWGKMNKLIQTLFLVLGRNVGWDATTSQPGGECR